MAEISPLRRQMIEDMTVRNLSPATQQSTAELAALCRAVRSEVLQSLLSSLHALRSVPAPASRVRSALPAVTPR